MSSSDDRIAVGVQQGRQQHEEHEVGVELDLGHPRQERHDDADRHEEDGRREAQEAGHGRDGDDTHDEGDDGRNRIHGQT